MLKDVAKAEKDFKIALLRYCNPVAAHPSGKIGEDPFSKPTTIKSK
jgi:UDP-glucose 4-epimerase